VTKDEFVQWRQASTTLEVFEILRAVRDAYADRVLAGGTLESLPETAKVVGTIAAFDYLLNINFEDEP
jgi:hypothetical protein